ncbi:MAG: carboxypeptidase C (cathepsin A) [Myxococcota bacterium]|jgi:carboxypeptidase C (cathepsin A)
MADDEKQDQPKKREASVTEHTLSAGGSDIAYEARADWMPMRDDDEKVIAEMFHVAYLQKDVDAASRPVTFVFNGGPGAASAYLHVGALGPRRIAFPDDGSLPPSPVIMVDNETSWLRFTDLVFIDPIGTGFSRTVPPKEGKDGKPDPKAEEKKKAFWNVQRDLQSLCDFIRRFLTQHKRWGSPVFIAGESYGGFRVARLLQQLQQQGGVGLSGAILISPALEFTALSGSDYDVIAWVDHLPTMAAAGYTHGRAAPAADTLEGHMAVAERFAREELSVALICGDAMEPERRRATFQKMADLTGLPLALVERCGGRVDIRRFCRELLKDQGEVVGLYDASVTAVDPYPDREQFQGPDPTLAGLDRLFTAGIYMQLREELGVEEDIRDYQLLSYDVFLSWRYDSDGQQDQGVVSATDQLRYGISLNEYTKVLISHGTFDLVTPYFTSNRLADLMRLTEAQKANLTIQHFRGGHMFYTHKASRDAFFETASGFYDSART